MILLLGCADDSCRRLFMLDWDRISELREEVGDAEFR